jgi:Rod binding domain-containing protein
MYNVRAYKNEVPPEVHDTTEAHRLKESCQQFESMLWAQIWKKMKTNARAIGGSDEKSRPWKQMEDLSVEMASEELAKSGGSGLWKVLYDQMITNVAAEMKKTGLEKAGTEKIEIEKTDGNEDGANV